jgi:gluconate 5-dehydrogenase
VTDSLRADGFAAHGSSFDLLDEGAIRQGIRQIHAAHGSIHILVNNAGVIDRSGLTAFELSAWNSMFQINVTAPMLVAREVVPDMIEAHAGKIINISSIMGDVARDRAGLYGVTKAALTRLTRSMCTEWAKYGVQANAIAPGYIKTDMTMALSEDEAFDGWVTERTPAARWGDPGDIAGAVVFLAAPASDFVNGHVLYVDGGLLAAL